MRGDIVLGVGIALLVALAGCAPREMAGTEGRPAGGASSAGRGTVSGAGGDTTTALRQSYRVEEETPEDFPQRSAELIEKIEPIRPDTIAVQDIAVEQAPKQLYSIGYRIQVFASSDRAAAERVKDRVVAQMRLATYIDYEDGLYKVRAGDFAGRNEAVQARLKLAGTYPGSWIVRTTIRQ